MIGKIKFKLGRREACAILTDAFTWTCNEKTLEVYLNEMFTAVASRDRRTARHLLYQVGERLGGEVMPEREHAIAG